MELSPLEILQQHWGYPQFRDPQDKIIDASIKGRDVFALLPTGAGKSICYQVAGLARTGITLVISPLLALMRDQVAQLNRRGIEATAINSLMSWAEIERRLTEAEKGKYKFIYLAPERLRNDLFLGRLPRLNIQLIAVDEAHCISQWGYDFRPAYLEIGLLRQQLPNVPMMALTATATKQVADDINEKLGFSNAAQFRKSFRRENLAFHVSETDNIGGAILKTAEKVNASGIVYARTRKRVEQFANALVRTGLKAAAYHGGMKPNVREQAQEQWITSEVPLIVATNAFGMGIDKPDVRFVAHLNLPVDPESYYQEAGRGGRDGKRANAFAFYNEHELSELARWVEDKYPPFEFVTQSYDALCAFLQVAEGALPDELFPVDLQEIAKRFDLSLIPFYNALRILHNEGWIALDESPDYFGWVQFAVSPAQVLQYKDEQPTMATLVDFMLRNLGGESWHEPVAFHPLRWQKRLFIDETELNSRLMQLESRGMIFYRPPTDLPSLRFLLARQPLSRQALNWSKYETLAERARLRLHAFVDYIKGTQPGCRAMILEAYFGETDGMPCGICDRCEESIAKANALDAVTRIRAEIRSLLTANPLDYISLIEHIKTGSREQRKEVVKVLLDKDWIVLKEGKLFIR